MTKTPPAVTTPSWQSVTRMAPPSVALAMIVALVGAGVGCGSSDSSTTMPPPSALDGADASADDASDIPQADSPEPVCELTGAPAVTAGEELVFADDFDGTKISTDKWTVENGEQGHGTILNTSLPDKVLVHDGSLFIATDHAPPGSTKPYAGGYIDARNKFNRTYGKYEFRARFPYVPGVWYAIWATPWSQPFPEIDIELTNVGGSQVWFVNHWAPPPIPADSRRAYFVAPKDVKHPTDGIDFSQFHTYALLWKPGLLELSIDGETKMQRTTQGVPDLPLVWNINSWVGGWGGEPTAQTRFPVTFEVDYVRVYRVDGLIADPSIRIVNAKTSYARSSSIEVAVADFDEVCAHVEMFDGPTRMHTTSKAPYTFSLSRLKRGQHTLSFVATDGARSTIASVDALIE